MVEISGLVDIEAATSNSRKLIFHGVQNKKLVYSTAFGQHIEVSLLAAEGMQREVRASEYVALLEAHNYRIENPRCGED